MDKSHTLGKFCSTAKKNTIILPKNIPGYKSPEGQVLKEDGQRFHFVYTPIEYNISYNLDGGVLDVDAKKSYTVEDKSYTPPVPNRNGYKFTGWEPKSIIKGTIGDVKFTATWKANPILTTGEKINKLLEKLVGNKEDIIGFEFGDANIDNGDYVDLSSTNTKIIATYRNRTIYLYSDDDIYCNEDMSHAFEGFTNLRNIDCFEYFICNPNTNINSIFKDCKMLSYVQPIDHWADGIFKDFTDAFSGTSALEALRVPSWYRWNVKINYVSSTGKYIKVIESDKIPGEIVYYQNIAGYKVINKEIKITSPSIEYTFQYNPIKYSISYELGGGDIFNPKTEYTIEDEAYYPPAPVKNGYKFTGWEPDFIASGDIGNMVFIATYTKGE